MESITTLNLNLQYPNFATTMHAVQNDKLSRKVQAILFDGSIPFVPDSSALAMIRYHKPDNTNGFYDVDENGNTAVTWTNNVCLIKLAEQALSCPGTVLCQVQFYTEAGQRLTTFTWRIEVQECALTDEQFISTDYYSILSAQISAAMSVTYRPPYIDSTTGHWMLWSVVTNQYEDSGYSAAGSPGEPGPTGAYVSSITRISGTGAAGETDTYQVNLSNGNVAGTFDVYNGEDGASVVSVERISGTGAGGSVDTYRINLSNGQSGGTFQVYNGADGQGSPGSATPLMDGTAAVGTAVAYAREDHVHPSDSSKVDVVDGKGLSSNDFTDALLTKLNGIADGADVSPVASASTPLMDGVGDPGSEATYSRSDHVHPADTTKQDKKINFSNVSVSSWYSDSTYSDYAYRGVIPLNNVTADMTAQVVFAPAQATSGNYAPVCQTYNGGVYIYSKVNTAITLLNICVFP